jgi:CRISPR-associated protein Cas5t
MKIIRVEAWQTTCNYKKPGSMQLKESFPLPPYSSVIGMVHAACGFIEYVDMQVSVQGEYYSLCNDQFTAYEFGPGTKYEEGRHNVKIPFKEGIHGAVKGMSNAELLVDVKLILHIKPSNEERLEVIQNGLLYPQNYLSLGRWEDLLRVDKVEMVDTFQSELEDFPVDAFVPENNKAFNNVRGTVYKINKKYTIEQKSGLRVWDEAYRVKHTPKGSRIYRNPEVLMDEKGSPVFLA